MDLALVWSLSHVVGMYGTGIKVEISQLNFSSCSRQIRTIFSKFKLRLESRSSFQYLEFLAKIYLRASFTLDGRVADANLFSRGSYRVILEELPAYGNMPVHNYLVN